MDLLITFGKIPTLVSCLNTRGDEWNIASRGGGGRGICDTVWSASPVAHVILKGKKAAVWTYSPPVPPSTTEICSKVARGKVNSWQNGVVTLKFASLLENILHVSWNCHRMQQQNGWLCPTNQNLYAQAKVFFFWHSSWEKEIPGLRSVPTYSCAHNLIVSQSNVLAVLLIWPSLNEIFYFLEKKCHYQYWLGWNTSARGSHKWIF